MKKTKRIYLSAILQDSGKTTVSLGLMQAFIDKGLKTGFIKPVGQKYVQVADDRVDKDSYLISKLYHFTGAIKDMSPVTVGHGFTQKYIFEPNKDELKSSILTSFERVAKRKDVVLIEGTGHAGVGSVFDWSNADVARLLDSQVIIISEGGIGKSIDEIVLNKALFDLKGVKTLGVIVNKVRPEKYEKVSTAVRRGLENKGIKLLGVIPYDPLLTYPTMGQVQSYLKLDCLCGRERLKNKVENTIIATMEPQNTISYFTNNVMMITSGDRIDNILVAISVHKRPWIKSYINIAGMILTGGIIPHAAIAELLVKSKIPVLVSSEDTYTLATKIKSLTTKIERTDKQKIQEAKSLAQHYVDVNAIIEGME